MEETGFLDYLMERFGISAPENCEILEGKRVKLAAKGLKNELYLNGKEIKNFGIGLNAGKHEQLFKPSTDFLQIFGFQCTRNVIFLNEKKAIAFLEGKEILLESNEEVFSTNGFVAVFWDGKCLGCGMRKDKKLESNVPKHRRINFQEKR